MTRSLAVLFVVAFLMALGLGAPAYAYLDPGTGSMLLQLVLGGIAGILVVGKLYWYRLKALFGFEVPRETSTESRREEDGK